MALILIGFSGEGRTRFELIERFRLEECSALERIMHIG